MKTSSNEGKVILKYINSFLNEYAPAIRNCSDHTLRNYSTALDQYLEWLEDNQEIGINTLASKHFSSDYVELWTAWLVNDKGQAKTTANVRLSSLKSFIHYLSRQDPKYRYLTLDIKEARPLRTPKKKIHGVSRKAIKALLSVIPTSTKTGKRYLVLFSLLYVSGARIDEILSLRLRDIHLECDHPYILVLGKNTKYRSIPLVGNIIKLLSHYIQYFHSADQCKDVFLFYTNHKGKQHKMSQTAVRNQLIKYSLEANKICPECPPHLHPHQLRHAKATHLLDDGMSDVQVAEFLGHSGLHTIQDYVDVNLEQKRKALETLTSNDDRSTDKVWKDGKHSMRIIAGTKRNHNK